MTQDEKDTVRVGEIRACLNKRLDQQISELGRLIRRGFQQRFEAEKYLKDSIGGTLDELDKLDSFAGLPQITRIVSGSGQ